MNRDELLTALERRRDVVSAYFAALPYEQFVNGTQEKCSPAHHLDHLVRSHKQLALALSMPKDRFGWKKRDSTLPGRSYEEIRDEYRRLLKVNAAKVSGRFVPEPQGIQADQLSLYGQSVDLLTHHLFNDVDELEMDDFTLPHPILGDLTIREMILFTLYHNEHHLNGVKAALEQP